MGQVAGVLVGDVGLDAAAGRLHRQLRQQLRHVPDLGREPSAFLRVVGVVGEQLSVLLHGGAAAGGVDDDGVDLRGEEGVDVAAGEGAGGRPVAVVGVEGAAAELPRRRHHLEAVARQHPHGGLVDAAEGVGHDAAGEQGDAPPRGALRSGQNAAAAKAAAVYRRCQDHSLTQEGNALREPAQAGGAVEPQQCGQRRHPAGPRDHLAQEESAQPPGESGPVRQDLRAGALHDAAVGDAGGADGLAVAALEAEVEVADGGRGGVDPLLGDRLDQVQPAPRRLGL